VVSLGIFSVVPTTEPCAMRSTQPLKVSTMDFSRSKGGRCLRLTNYHPWSAKTSRKSEALIYPEPIGPPRSVAGDIYFYYIGVGGQHYAPVALPPGKRPQYLSYKSLGGPQVRSAWLQKKLFLTGFESRSAYPVTRR